MYLTKWFLVVVPVLALAPEATAASERAPSTSNDCIVRVRGVDQSGELAAQQRYRNTRISAYETSRIELRAYCVAEATASTLTVRVFLPNGDLYETLETMEVEAAPHRGRRRRRHIASSELPVAGTLVTQYQLFGEWSAKVCRDDKTASSCGRASRFTLED